MVSLLFSAGVSAKLEGESMSRKTLVSCATLALLISGNVFAQDAAPDTTQPDPALAELE
ncbi:MAG: hypothetical protein ACI89L_002840, partial [Phycisphaerales bacterium]